MKTIGLANEQLRRFKDGTGDAAWAAFWAVWQKILSSSIKLSLKVRHHKQRSHWHRRVPGALSGVWDRGGHCHNDFGPCSIAHWGIRWHFKRKSTQFWKSVHCNALIGVYLSNKLFFYAKQGWKTERFNLVILVLALVSASHVQRKWPQMRPSLEYKPLWLQHLGNTV